MRRLLLGLAVAATTLVPSVVSADDTHIADFIQTRLKGEQQDGNLRGFNVDMQVEKGIVWFRGTVSNAKQEMLILKTAQQAGHLGVVQVVDDIEVAKSPVRPVSYAKPQVSAPPFAGDSIGFSAPAPAPIISSGSGTQQSFGGFGGGGVVSEPLPFAACSSCAAGAQPNFGAPVADFGGQIVDYGTPVSSFGPPISGGFVGGGEPLPISAGGGGGGGGVGGPSGSPNLPGYAWPGYAAHPNFGAVSYPRQYSASAWPYIGPFYPYPQVPLGWRKVSLEWDDGFWHLDFKDKSRH